MSFNNELKLIGNVVKDPDVYESERGKFGRLRLACNTKRGETEDTLFIDVKLFGGAFKDFEYHEVVKGDKILVYGRLAVEEYTAKDESKRREPIVYANGIIKLAKKASAKSGSSF